MSDEGYDKDQDGWSGLSSPKNSSSNHPESREGQALNVMIERDVALFHKALVNGWDVSPERRRMYFAALDDAVRNVEAIEDADARGRFLAAAVKCVVADRALQVRMYEAMLRRLGAQNVAEAIAETFGQQRKNSSQKEAEFSFEGFAALQRSVDSLGKSKEN